MEEHSLLATNSVTYYFIYKPFFVWLQKFIPIWIHPNVITLSNLFIVNILSLSGYYTNPYLFSFVLFLYFCLDNLDGIHARETKQSSSMGEILDHCSDNYNITLIFNMFFSIFGIPDGYLKNVTVLILLYQYCCPNLLHKYDGHTSLSIGFKYLGIDDILLSVTILPFVASYKLLSPNLISLVVKCLWTAGLFHIVVVLKNYYNIYNKTIVGSRKKLSMKRDFLGYLSYGMISYYCYCVYGIYLAGFMNSMYVLYLILTREKLKH
jgi:phosphatidylglycerophosphate synthase